MTYDDFLAGSADLELARIIEYLSSELKYKWLGEYQEMTPHPIEVVETVLESFTYVFDLYGQMQSPESPDEGEPTDGRLVAAFGTSKPPTYDRESSRLRGWIGPTGAMLGSERDKGHFIAHTIGGHIDRFEINLFSQLRHINRGWSERGKVYRRMEEFCATNPGTFCFSRPFYEGLTCRPQRLEFGLLRPDKTLWVEEFQN